MRPFQYLIAGAAGLLLVGPAVAQRVGAEHNAPPQQSVQVQTNISLFVEDVGGTSEDAEKLRYQIRRRIYEMAAHECDLLREVIAKDCRLETVTSNIRQRSGQRPQQDGYDINGSLRLQITLK
ncbi:hypothetical protein OO17_05525 [Rhodopseudomonas palustris]|uniref:UrcA family protein n=1 Tax=Rhodopseudomonas palustris TaxID=1076 RepID=A0A0D7F2X1_RHOPL|nr:hypothetical protein [Rhodopseudomonas sp. BAL398]KIZ47145.1 hypothetical protein OO17_05525 [Rhodopseudomonas palustris]MDF3813593.1 hypothetical protein [Rhodopseudomonas sp. BAL398]WOK15728.1 hypothetical protein RBJ75_16255 [Rhodopseudomonas sp. BAL398]